MGFDAFSRQASSDIKKGKAFKRIFKRIFKRTFKRIFKRVFPLPIKQSSLKKRDGGRSFRGRGFIEGFLPGAYRKVSTNRGASITYALLLFLVCAVVSSIVLVAGTAAGGRMANLAESDQKYFNVASAAEVLRDMLEGKRVTVERTLVSRELWHHDGSSGEDKVKEVSGAQVTPIPVKDTTSFVIDDGTLLSDLDYILMETDYGISPETGDFTAETTIDRRNISDDSFIKEAEYDLKNSFLLDAAQSLLETTVMSETYREADETLFSEIYPSAPLSEKKTHTLVVRGAVGGTAGGFSGPEEGEGSDTNPDMSQELGSGSFSGSGASSEATLPLSGEGDNPLEGVAFLLTETVNPDKSISFLIQNAVRGESAYVEDPDNILRMTLLFECKSRESERSSTSDGEWINITEGPLGAAQEAGEEASGEAQEEGEEETPVAQDEETEPGEPQEEAGEAQQGEEEAQAKSVSYDYYKTTTTTQKTTLEWSLVSVKTGGDVAEEQEG